MQTQSNQHAQESSPTPQIQLPANQNEHADNQSENINTENLKSSVRNLGVRSTFVIVHQTLKCFESIHRFLCFVKTNYHIN